jgi:hypothetical protein
VWVAGFGPVVLIGERREIVGNLWTTMVLSIRLTTSPLALGLLCKDACTSSHAIERERFGVYEGGVVGVGETTGLKTAQFGQRRL